MDEKTQQRRHSRDQPLSMANDKNGIESKEKKSSYYNGRGHQNFMAVDSVHFNVSNSQCVLKILALEIERYRTGCETFQPASLPRD